MYEIYNVLDGDTLESIAKKFNTTEEVIYQLNGLDDNFDLNLNMQLVVPKNDYSNYWYYTVKKGDNIVEIAKEYQQDYKILLALNGLDDNDYIYPNQTLIIPRDGVILYMTDEKDTIRNVVDKFHIELNELMKENENIYLRPEQILAFKKK